MSVHENAEYAENREYGYMLIFVELYMFGS